MCRILYFTFIFNYINMFNFGVYIYKMVSFNYYLFYFTYSGNNIFNIHNIKLSMHKYFSL